jgi:lysophospholipase L1-like esterase
MKRTIQTFVLSLLSLLLGLTLAPAFAVPTIYTIGDSTVQSYVSSYYPLTGWGQELQFFFDANKVKVNNKAVAGTSSKSFYNTYWSAIKTSLKPGDFVTIQFGINDAKSDDPARYTIPFDTFDAYLTTYVNETKAMGAYPILVSPLNRNSWNATTPPTIYPAYHDYPVAVRQLAPTLGVPLIDLDRLCTTLLESVGPNYSTKFIYLHTLPGEYANYPSGKADDVHFQEMGAIEMARLIVQGIQNLSADANVSTLIPALKPTYPVTFTVNDANAGTITRSASFPAGVNITTKAMASTGYEFRGWGGGLSGINPITAFTMGSAAKTITATFATPSTAYQAESATRAGTGTVVENKNAGYLGTGYINFPTTGGSLTFSKVDGGAGGTKVLRFRFALGVSPARKGQLVVNGVTSAITFNPTGAWSTWVNLDVSATLKAGTTNTIQLKSTGADLGNVDQLSVF